MSFNDSLSKEQEEYFKNSVIRDDNGGLLKVYHGTTEQAVFRSFDSSKIGVGNGTGNGAGFNFTDSLEVANNYATHNTIDGGTSPIVIDKPFGHIYEVYLNIQHPLSSDDVTLTKEEMANAFYNAIGQFESMARVDYDSDAKSEASDKMVEEILSKGSNPMHTDINVLNEITESVNEFLHSDDDNFHEIEAFLSERYIEAHYDEINEAYGEDWDTEDILGWDFADRSIEAETNNFIKESIGYDGFKGTMFGGGNVYVALEPDQIKAVNNLQPTHSQDMFENYPIRKEHNGMNLEIYDIRVDSESPLQVSGTGNILSDFDDVLDITRDEIDSFRFDYNLKTHSLSLSLELNEPDRDNFDTEEDYEEAMERYEAAYNEYNEQDVPSFEAALRDELMNSSDLIEEFNGSIHQGDVEGHRVEDDKYLTVEGKIHMGDTTFDFRTQNSYMPAITYTDSFGNTEAAPPWVNMHCDLALAIEQEYESLDVSYEITRNDKGLYDIKGELGSNLETPFSGSYDPKTRELKLEIDEEKSRGIYEIKPEIKEEIKERIEEMEKEMDVDELIERVFKDFDSDARQAAADAFNYYDPGTEPLTVSEWYDELRSNYGEVKTQVRDLMEKLNDYAKFNDITFDEAEANEALTKLVEERNDEVFSYMIESFKEQGLVKEPEQEKEFSIGDVTITPNYMGEKGQYNVGFPTLHDQDNTENIFEAGSIKELGEKLLEYADNYDVDENVALWLKGDSEILNNPPEWSAELDKANTFVEKLEKLDDSLLKHSPDLSGYGVSKGYVIETIDTLAKENGLYFDKDDDCIYLSYDNSYDISVPNDNDLYDSLRSEISETGYEQLVLDKFNVEDHQNGAPGLAALVEDAEYIKETFEKVGRELYEKDIDLVNAYPEALLKADMDLENSYPELQFSRTHDVNELADIISDKLEMASGFHLDEDLASLADEAAKHGVDVSAINSDIEAVKAGTINATEIQEHMNEVKEAYNKEADKDIKRDEKEKGHKKEGMDI